MVDLTEIAFRDGKLTTLEVLRRVLNEMKSQETNPTAVVMNLVLEEIYRKVETEVL